MPTCPGCECAVSYERLPAHVDHCERLGEKSPNPGPNIEPIEYRMERAEERMLQRIRRLEWASERRDDSDRRPPENSRIH